MKNNTVLDIQQEFTRLLKNEEFVIDKSGVKTVEIAGATFEANTPIIFGIENQEYIERELKWYLPESLNVNDMEGQVPAIWQQISSEEGKINSNYGWAAFSRANGNQYTGAALALLNDPYTRRAIIIYTRPSMQVEYNTDGMSDFICTSTVQYLYRDGKLDAIVNMRSNDAVFGYKNDYAWQKYVLDGLVSGLQISPMFTEPIEAGKIIWNAGSLHVYERHFKFILGE